MTYELRGEYNVYVVCVETGMIAYEKGEWLEDSYGLITSGPRYSGVSICETTLDTAIRLCEVFQV